MLLILVIICGILFVIFITKKNTLNNNKSPADDSYNNNSLLIIKNPESVLNNSIDSILFTFGLKKEWITTDTLKSHNKADWFVKSVLIPKELTSVEVNLDISTYLNQSGLRAKVTEDIISKDITITVNNPDTTKTFPAAMIQITHSDKINRESGVVSIIIDKITEFNPEDLDKLIITKNEFSYVFPRNLDDIEIQHKLLQHKKDIVISMSIGSRENYEADFNTEMDEKSIREKVKNFNSDYPSINKVLITKIINPAPSLQNKITAEFQKYNITVINDTSLTNAYKSGEDNKLGNFFRRITQKAGITKYIITVLPVEKTDFDEFYRHVMVMKKLGYRFLNLSNYFDAIRDDKKKDQEKEEKNKLERVKKKTQDDLKKKRTPDKKETKKNEPKKTEKKKK